MKTIHNPDYIEIITRLRTVRITQNITQKQLANKLNVSQSFVSKVENCEIALDIMEFLNWAKILHVNLHDLIPKKFF